MSDSPATVTEPVDVRDPAQPEHSPVEDVLVEDVMVDDVMVEDVLVEEVSIDGMCGVY